MNIAFDDEAGETFQRLLGQLRGFGGEVTTVDGETFPCIVAGRPPDAYAASEWLDGLAVRPWNFDKDMAVGELRAVRVQQFLVY